MRYLLPCTGTMHPPLPEPRPYAGATKLPGSVTECRRERPEVPENQGIRSLTRLKAYLRYVGGAAEPGNAVDPSTYGLATGNV